MVKYLAVNQLRRHYYEITDKSTIFVVVPRVATPRELFAAEELSKYFSAILPGITRGLLGVVDPLLPERRADGNIDQKCSNMVGKSPAVDTLSIMPQDGTALQCVCPECSKYTKTENDLYFANELICRVKKVRPDIVAEILAYTDLWQCPEGAVVEKM